MSELSPVSFNGALPQSDPRGASAKTKDAAQQFEALLIQSMLQSCRQEASWMGSGDESGGSTAIGYAEQHLAQALAAQGGFGIATTVMSALDPAQNLPYARTAGAAAASASTPAETPSELP